MTTAEGNREILRALATHIRSCREATGYTDIPDRLDQADPAEYRTEILLIHVVRMADVMGDLVTGGMADRAMYDIFGTDLDD